MSQDNYVALIVENEVNLQKCKFANFLLIEPPSSLSFHGSPYKVINSNILSVDLAKIDSSKGEGESTKLFEFTELLSGSLGHDNIFSTCCQPLVDDLLSGTNGLLLNIGQSFISKGSMEDPSLNPGLISSSLTSVFSKYRFVSDDLIGTLDSCDIVLMDCDQRNVHLKQRDEILCHSSSKQTPDFYLIGNSMNDDGYKYNCYLTYFQVSYGTISDLLSPSLDDQMRSTFRVSAFESNHFLKGLRSVVVTSLADALNVYSFGWKNHQRNIQISDPRAHTFGTFFRITLVKFKKNNDKLLQSQLSHFTIGNFSDSHNNSHIKQLLQILKKSNKYSDQNSSFNLSSNDSKKVWMIVNMVHSPFSLHLNFDSLQLGSDIFMQMKNESLIVTQQVMSEIIDLQKTLHLEEKVQKELTCELRAVNCELKKKILELKELEMMNFHKSENYEKVIKELNEKVSSYQTQTQVTGINELNETLQTEYEQKLKSIDYDHRSELLQAKEEILKLKEIIFKIPEEYVSIKKHEDVKRSYEKEINKLRFREELNLDKLRDTSNISINNESQTEGNISLCNRSEIFECDHVNELKELRKTLEDEYKKKLSKLKKNHKFEMNELRIKLTQTEADFFSRDEYDALKLSKEKELQEYKLKSNEETNYKLESLRKELYKPEKITVDQDTQTVISSDEFAVIEKSTFSIIKDLQNDLLFEKLDKLRRELPGGLVSPVPQDNMSKIKSIKRKELAVSPIEKRIKFINKADQVEYPKEQRSSSKKSITLLMSNPLLDPLRSRTLNSSDQSTTLYMKNPFSEELKDIKSLAQQIDVKSSTLMSNYKYLTKSADGRGYYEISTDFVPIRVCTRCSWFEILTNSNYYFHLKTHHNLFLDRENPGYLISQCKNVLMKSGTFHTWYRRKDKTISISEMEANCYNLPEDHVFAQICSICGWISVKFRHFSHFLKSHRSLYTKGKKSSAYSKIIVIKIQKEETEIEMTSEDEEGEVSIDDTSSPEPSDMETVIDNEHQSPKNTNGKVDNSKNTNERSSNSLLSQCLTKSSDGHDLYEMLPNHIAVRICSLCPWMEIITKYQYSHHFCSRHGSVDLKNQTIVSQFKEVIVDKEILNSTTDRMIRNGPSNLKIDLEFYNIPENCIFVKKCNFCPWIEKARGTTFNAHFINNHSEYINMNKDKIPTNEKFKVMIMEIKKNSTNEI